MAGDPVIVGAAGGGGPPPLVGTGLLSGLESLPPHAASAIAAAITNIHRLVEANVSVALRHIILIPRTANWLTHPVLNQILQLRIGALKPDLSIITQASSLSASEASKPATKQNRKLSRWTDMNCD